MVEHALMYYDGTRTGDVLSYNCQNDYKLVGYSMSICMIDGTWSHRVPKCRGLLNLF
jgi:hypothetical protein